MPAQYDSGTPDFSVLDVSLPKTGQTTVYQAGDDGTYQAGNPLNPRFVNNLDGTISDNITGLMWISSTNGVNDGAGGLYDFGIFQTWGDTLIEIDNLNAGAGYAGFHDWRMANILELISILNFQGWGGLGGINGTPFGNTFASTTNPVNGNAFVIDFAGGVISDEAKTNTEGTVLVRGGQHL